MPMPDFPVLGSWGTVLSLDAPWPRGAQNYPGDQAGGCSPSLHLGKLGAVLVGLRGRQSSCLRSFRPGLGVGNLGPAQLRPNLIECPIFFLKKSLSQSEEEDGYLAQLLGAGQAWKGSRGPGRALPLDDELDAVAGLQDLPELGDPEAVGPAEGDAFRQPHHKQLLWVHQELGVGHLDRLRDANGLGCRDMAAVGPPRSMGPRASTPTSHVCMGGPQVLEPF